MYPTNNAKSARPIKSAYTGFVFKDDAIRGVADGVASAADRMYAGILASVSEGCDEAEDTIDAGGVEERLSEMLQHAEELLELPTRRWPT